MCPVANDFSDNHLVHINMVKTDPKFGLSLFVSPFNNDKTIDPGDGIMDKFQQTCGLHFFKFLF